MLSIKCRRRHLPSIADKVTMLRESGQRRDDNAVSWAWGWGWEKEKRHQTRLRSKDVE